jgi:protein SCO1/2
MIGNRSAATPRPATHAPVQLPPNVALRTQDGKKVRLCDDLLRDKIALINFFYTRCTAVCGLATSNLLKVERALGDRLGNEIVMVSVTIDPDHDSPKVLKEYAERHGTGPAWYFVTGERREIMLLRDRLGLRDPGDTATHTELVVYGNAATGQWAATPVLASPRSLVRNITMLMQLASQAK